jgi:hypothetical protein
MQTWFAPCLYSTRPDGDTDDLQRNHPLLVGSEDETRKQQEDTSFKNPGKLLTIRSFLFGLGSALFTHLFTLSSCYNVYVHYGQHVREQYKDQHEQLPFLISMLSEIPPLVRHLSAIIISCCIVYSLSRSMLDFFHKECGEEEEEEEEEEDQPTRSTITRAKHALNRGCLVAFAGVIVGSFFPWLIFDWYMNKIIPVGQCVAIVMIDMALCDIMISCHEDSSGDCQQAAVTDQEGVDSLLEEKV